MFEFDPAEASSRVELSKDRPAAPDVEGAAYDDSALRSSLLMVALVTLATWVVIATHTWAFFPDPVNSGSGLRGVELALSTVAWVLLAVGPIAIVWAFRAGDDYVLRYLPVAALAWPVSVLVIHLTLKYQAGDWYFDYLTNYPAFLITDILAPAVYLWVWRRLSQWRVK